MGSQDDSYSGALSLLLQLLTIRKTHVPIKACKINEHTVYAG